MTIRETAALAKLRLSADDEKRLAADFDDILRFAGALQSLDLKGVPPTHHIVPLENVLRQDIAEPSLDRETVLAAAPVRQGDYISVPRAVE